nr:hypothetical protein [Tanacetum cinerariifolium]
MDRSQSSDSHNNSIITDSRRKLSALRKNDEERQTVTMRELLTELKNADHSNQTSPSSVVSTTPRSQESKQQKERNSAVMALINSISTSDEEGRSRQRAYYNWAIAISDRAKLHGRTKEAEELWKQATKKYEKAVQLNWNSPQALNNWGLALQELSAIVPAREKQKIVRSAISKFRAAVQLQFDFHRAIYNLGTVLYGLAEDTSRTGVLVIGNEISSNELYSQSAIYIAAAHALKPSYSVYTSALKLVRSMLPLPYLKVGFLSVPPVENPVAPHIDWRRFKFVLNHDGLQQIHDDEPKNIFGDKNTNTKPAIRVDIPDVVSVTICSDLTLPPGPSFCINTIHGPIFLIADSWEYLEAWFDALRLVYTIFARRKTDVLAGIITG